MCDLIETTDERDLDVTVVDCAACGKLLLGPKMLTELRGLIWSEWPPLAWRLFKAGDTVKRHKRIGEHDRPFCARCLEEKMHEVLREQHFDRVQAAAVLRAVRPILSYRDRPAPLLFNSRSGRAGRD